MFEKLELYLEIINDFPYKFTEIQLMLLPVCVMLLPNEQIKDFWETESKFIVKCKNTKPDNSVNYDILYEVDKETGEANKMK